MKRITLAGALILISTLLLAQNVGDSIPRIKVKRRSNHAGIEGVATVGGMYYGKMHVDTFLRCEHIDVSQDSGRLSIVSFEAYYTTKGTSASYNSASSKIPEALKELIKEGGGHIHFEKVTAARIDGSHVTLNPIMISLHDVLKSSITKTSPRDQSTRQQLAVVAGICDGELEPDSLLKHEAVEILNAEEDMQLTGYSVSVIYKGQYFSQHTTTGFPDDLKKLLKSSPEKVSRVMFENIKMKRSNGDIIVLNPVIIRIKSRKTR